jgi:hypothetical protein
MNRHGNREPVQCISMKSTLLAAGFVRGDTEWYDRRLAEFSEVPA